jgi:hypothetical protein
VALTVNVEDLAAPCIGVTQHGEDVATEQAAADRRTESAATGRHGAPASATAVKSAARVQTTRSLPPHPSHRARRHAEGRARNARKTAKWDAGKAACAIEATGR